MPLLIVLGMIVVLIALAIFKVKKVQSDRFIAEKARRAKMAEDADDDRDGDMKGE